jgi:quinol---cytochrome c reductase iron-sulfur subunit, bacillus type
MCTAPTSPPSPSRRGFLFRLGVALNVLGGALVGIPLVGYIVAPARRHERQSWIALGAVSQYPEGETRLAVYDNPASVPWDGVSAKTACWVRRIDGERFQIFAINCAHLGCPVRWFPQSRLFMCPCHGGVYYEDGSRASGPPPRGLYQYEYEIRDGRLWVRGGQLPTLAGPV